MNRIVKLGVLLSLFSMSALANANSASPFSNFYLFGDSLSDLGNLQPTALSPGAPETTPGPNGSPGLLWVNVLANKLDIHVAASSQGGNDFAFGGAISGPLPSDVAISPGTPMVTGPGGQIPTFINSSGGHIDPNALYSVWVGANDLKAAVTTPGFTQADAIGFVNQSTTNILNGVSQLHAAGAKYIIVANIPNIGNTPALNNQTFVNGEYYASVFAKFQNALPNNTPISIIAALTQNFINHNPPPNAAAAQAAGIQLSNTYNDQLLSTLNRSGFHIIQTDANGLFTAFIDRPTQFGFSSAGASYCVPGVAANGEPTLICNGNPNTSIFFDGFHPSQAAGAIYGQYVYSVLQGPTFAALLAEVPTTITDNQNDAIHTQLLGIQTGVQTVPCGHYQVFAGGITGDDSVSTDGFEQQGYDNDSNAYTVGVEYRLTSNSIVGAAIGRSMGDVDFAGNAGGFDLDENLGTLFGGYQYQNLYADAELNYGIISYGDIKRNIPLGPVLDTVMGDTTGQDFGAAGNIGYNFVNTNLKTGPIADLDFQRVNVEPYAERSEQFSAINDPFDALQYTKQTNDSFYGGLGWQASYLAQFNCFRLLPFIQATGNYQFLSQNRNVQAGVVTLPGSNFTIPVTAPDGGFVLANVGIQGIFNNGVSLTVGYDVTLAQQDTNQYNFLVSAGVPL